MIDPHTKKQLKIIEATLKNAMIEVVSLRNDCDLLEEENIRLTKMVEFLMMKSGDIHAEQTA
jgi:hypothetical protein